MSPPPQPLVRIGLTGARGVLGRSLKAACPDVAWSDFPGDVEDVGQLTQWLIQSGTLDAVLHFAAIVPTGRVDADPAKAIRVNVGGTCNLLKALHDTGHASTWCFLASSSHVYRSQQEPVREVDAVGPSTLYGLSKLQAEQWAESLAARYGISMCIGRIFSFTSPLQPPSYFVPAMIARLSDPKVTGRLEVPGLHGTRDFSTPDQIAHAIRLLQGRRATGTFNIGSGGRIRLYDIVEAIRQRLGRQDITIVATAEGTAHLSADVSKLRAAGVELKWDLDAMLDQMLSPTR